LKNLLGCDLLLLAAAPFEMEIPKGFIHPESARSEARLQQI